MSAEPARAATPATPDAAPSRHVGRRAAEGARWMFGLNFTNRALGLVRTAIIARLLGPGQLGVFGAALLFMTVLEALTQTGLRTALIQKKDEIGEYLDTAWVWNVARGTLVGAAMFVGAPYVAGFFNEPSLVLLVRLIALVEVVTGLANVDIVQYARGLEFKRVYVYEAVSSVVDVTVSIAAALILRSALALVIGYLARYVTWTVMTYVIHPFRPKFRFDRKKAAELFRFGRWVTGSAWLELLYSSGDDVFVGRILGTTSLGLYQIAYKYSNLPTTEITRVVQLVALPAYSRLQGDAERFAKAFLDVLKVTTLASITFAGFIWVLAGDLMWLILGPKWTAVVPLLRLLAVWGALESMSEVSTAVFQAAGHPQRGTQVMVMKTVILAVLIWPLSSLWGVTGTCVAVVCASLPALALSLGRAATTTGVTAGRIMATITPPIVAASLAAAGGVAVLRLVPEQSMLSIAARTAMLLVVYGGAAAIAKAAGYDGVSKLVGTVRNAVSG